MANVTREQVIDFLGNVSVMELCDMRMELEETWGVSATTVPYGHGVVDDSSYFRSLERERLQGHEYEVTLTSFGAKKISVIKVLRQISDLGLGEAKALVERAPVVVMHGVTEDEGLEIAEQFRAVGAEAEISPVPLL